MLASILMAQQQQGGARAHSRQAWLLCLAPVNGSVAAWLAPPLWLGVTPVRAHTGRSHSAEERVPRCRSDRPGLGLNLATPRGLWTDCVGVDGSRVTVVGSEPLVTTPGRASAARRRVELRRPPKAGGRALA
jgi:hypothetical protein